MRKSSLAGCKQPLGTVRPISTDGSFRCTAGVDRGSVNDCNSGLLPVSLTPA